LTEVLPYDRVEIQQVGFLGAVWRVTAGVTTSTLLRYRDDSLVTAAADSISLIDNCDVVIVAVTDSTGYLFPL